jgi:molybdopterin molybdotransferase
LQGESRVLPSTIRARLENPITRDAGRMEFYRAILEDGVVRVLANQASGAVVAMARANALCVVAADTTKIESGSLVDVIPFWELGL